MVFLLCQKTLIRRSWRPPELSELRGARECGGDSSTALIGQPGGAGGGGEGRGLGAGWLRLQAAHPAALYIGLGNKRPLMRCMSGVVHIGAQHGTDALDLDTKLARGGATGAKLPGLVCFSQF